MEYKLKENINVNSLTFRKKVMEETIDLLGVIKNYTLSDLKFNLMLGFLDNIIEGNILLEELAKSTRLVSELEDTIEPLYKDVVVSNELYLQVYNELLKEIIDYADREVENNHNLTGLLYNIIDGLGELKQEDIMFVLNQVAVWAANKFVPTSEQKELIKKEKNTKIETEKKESSIDVQDQKMLDLIEKFKNQGNVA